MAEVGQGARWSHTGGQWTIGKPMVSAAQPAPRIPALGTPLPLVADDRKEPVRRQPSTSKRCATARTLTGSVHRSPLVAACEVGMAACCYFVKCPHAALAGQQAHPWREAPATTSTAPRCWRCRSGRCSPPRWCDRARPRSGSERCSTDGRRHEPARCRRRGAAAGRGPRRQCICRRLGPVMTTSSRPRAGNTM
jgi:hypothetical protein